MTYEELMAEAKIVYDNVAKNSPFCAQFEARKVIASKIDQCSDRDEHLNVLEWDEYKNNYAPMKRETYELRKQMAKESYERTLAEIEKRVRGERKVFTRLSQDLAPCIIAVPRLAVDSKRGNRRDAERSQRTEPTGLHRSRQVQPPVL